MRDRKGSTGSREGGSCPCSFSYSVLGRAGLTQIIPASALTSSNCLSFVTSITPVARVLASGTSRGRLWRLYQLSVVPFPKGGDLRVTSRQCMDRQNKQTGSIEPTRISRRQIQTITPRQFIARYFYRDLVSDPDDFCFRYRR